MQSRVEDILQAMIDGTDSSELPKSQSRNEVLLKEVLDKMNDVDGSKLDANQGAVNSGKVMGVDAEGDVVPVEVEGGNIAVTETPISGDDYSIDIVEGAQGSVTSVAGKTGAVTLNGDDVSYSDLASYENGTVGGKIADLADQIDEISQTGIDASGATEGQVPTADGEGGWEWDDPAGGVSDVQVNGTSILDAQGVANVSAASYNGYGVVRVGADYGITINSSGRLTTTIPTDTQIKAGDNQYRVISTNNQHKSTFYGLAKAAGDTTQSESSNAVGQYTESAKSAISTMLNGAVTVTGTTPSITALPGIRYVCGEVSTLDITLPASGIVDVVFESGSTPAVLTITPPTGQTVRWANGFDPTALDANCTYEISIADGLGVAASWT